MPKTVITVQLTRVDDQLEIIVEDDGIGFDESSTQKRMGLDNIRSRFIILRAKFPSEPILAAALQPIS
ncbi:MAG: hypothetical protein U0T81_00235 [Saprospiraceae bacterium]